MCEAGGEHAFDGEGEGVMIDTEVIQELWAEIRDAIREEDHDHHYEINQSDSLPASYLLLKEALFKYYGDGYKDASITQS